MARLVGLFCWSSEALLESLADSLHVGELVLFRRIDDRLPRGIVVLGDRYFGSYYDCSGLIQRGLDGVFRLHQRRPTDGRHGTRLGPQDRRITWTKPRILPRGIGADEWAAVPETLTVRQVRACVGVPGFRSRRLDLVTTLLDPQRYPAEQLVALYRDRWMVELNLRALKTTLKMEVLRCKSAEMVRKELYVYQIAYNLIRLLMWQAAQRHGRDPRRLSLAGAQQRIVSTAPYLEQCRTPEQRGRLIRILLARIAGDTVPDRRDRIEPRCVKRRPKNYQRLTQPRAEARARCRRNPQVFQR